jgi:DNA-binding response OmpR family regulator
LRDAADLRVRALVVEDDRDAADTLAVLLRRDGLDVAVARDGLDALVQASQQKPDVVLLDVLLPKLNGLEVCTYIRATEWGKRTAVIALTGWSRTSDMDQIARAGFDCHLVKPFGVEELLRAVHSTIEIRRSGE